MMVRGEAACKGRGRATIRTPDDGRV